MARPNILFVFDDQHRFSALGSSGNPVIKTPHFDQLASEGVVLDQVFSSCPICSPFRGQLMTGRYSHKNGVMDNEYQLRQDQAFLPQVLGNEGYHTAFIGKWHLGYPPFTLEQRYGFDYMAAYNCKHDYYNVSYYENEQGPIEMNDWAPEEETSLAIRFLDNHMKDQPDNPFAIILSWGPPHWPYDQYPKSYNIYSPDKVNLPQNVPEQFSTFAKQELADYYGNVTALDAQMGRLMDALDRLGLSDNTLLIFTSDHGDHLSSHGYGKPMDQWMHPSFRASKATPFDESIHVPFIARWPGHISPGTTNDAIISSVDLMPTLISIAGGELSDQVQGHDMSHILLGKEGPRSDSAYLQILGPGWPHRGKWVGYWRGLRTDRWVYARWYQNEYGPLLFDRMSDPGEMTNLAGDPDYSRIQADLEKRLQKWMLDTDDPFDTGPRDEETGMLALGQEFNHDQYT